MTALIDIHGKPLRSGAATSLHQAAELADKGELAAFGIIMVKPDGSVVCDIGHAEGDGENLKLIAQGCGTIVGYLRSEFKRSCAPDPAAKAN